MPEKYILRHSAVRDLQEIWDYTSENWSIDQAEAYDRLLQRSFEQVAELTGLGKPVPSRTDGSRLIFTGLHVVVYRPEPKPVRIVRILHQQSDWQHLLSEDLETE